MRGSRWPIRDIARRLDPYLSPSLVRQIMHHRQHATEAAQRHP
jgi:hypothetical protein